MGAGASVTDQWACPYIVDMRSHEVQAHSSIQKALRRDYHSTQSLLRRMLSEFEQHQQEAVRVAISDSHFDNMLQGGTYSEA